MPQLNDVSGSPGTLIPYKGRSYTWLPIKEEGTIILSAGLMDQISLHVGTELLSIRSSDIAITMGVKSPLLEKAHDYAGIIPKY